MNFRSRIIMPPQAADSNFFLTTNACQRVIMAFSQKAFVFVTYSRHEFDYLTLLVPEPTAPTGCMVRS
jgi:hypothetical protein